MGDLQRQISLVLGAVFLTVFGLTILGELLALENGAWTGTGVETETGDPAAADADELASISVAGAVLVLLGSSSFLVAGVRESVRIAGREIGWWQWMNVGFCVMAVGWIGPLVAEVQAELMPGLIPLGVAIATLLFGLVRLGREQPAAIADGEPFPLEAATTVVVGGILIIFSVMYVQLFFSLT